MRLPCYSIDYLRGSSYGEYFDNANYLNKSESRTIEQKLKKLAHGRVDLIVSSEIIIYHTINTDLKEYQGKIEKLTPVLKINTLFNIFSKKSSEHQEMVNSFNKGLNIMREDGTLLQLSEKHSIPLSSQIH